MYIKSIEVENFGQFEHKKVSLVDGLVVVRGANESGKSTLTRTAPLYALFGSSTLDVNLQDIVRLGATRMKVTLEYGPYTVKRSPTAASVEGNGVQISGQDEVSSFFYNLFGLARGSEDAVLVARQGDTQGIVSKRPGEVAAFIEGIAGFSQIDELVEKVKLKYPSGSKAVIEELLETSNEKLLLSKISLEERLKSFDLGAYYTEITLLTRAVDKAEQTKADAEKNLEAEKEFQNKNREHNHKVELYKKDLQNANEKLEALKLKSEELLKDYSSVRLYTQEEIETAKELLTSAAQRRKDLAAKAWVDSIPEHNEWEGTIEYLREEIAIEKEKLFVLEEELAANRVAIISCERGINNKEFCGECGQSVAHIHAELNRVNKENLLIRNEERIELEASCKKAKDYKRSLEEVLLTDLKPVEHHQISADKNFVPNRYAWIGDDPKPISDELVAQASSLLADSEAEGKRLTKINAEIVSNSNAILETETKIASLVSPGEVKEISNGVIDRLNETIGWLNKEITTHKLTVTALEKSISEFENEKKNLENSIKETEKAIKDLNVRLLAEDRNSKILKAVRDARPKVIDLIWSTVLENTAATFASIRGKVEEIEKTPKGFKVGGIPIQGLSGSAKSVFGIALRMVLRDMFAPTAGFIILDEPFGDADQERTFAGLAALQVMNDQRIIITHESYTEAAADQVIEL
jgi:DNA repair exonuclease SbcCD ATPase subunit